MPPSMSSVPAAVVASADQAPPVPSLSPPAPPPKSKKPVVVLELAAEDGQEEWEKKAQRAQASEQQEAELKAAAAASLVESLLYVTAEAPEKDAAPRNSVARSRTSSSVARRISLSRSSSQSDVLPDGVRDSMAERESVSSAARSEDTDEARDTLASESSPVGSPGAAAAAAAALKGKNPLSWANKTLRRSSLAGVLGVKPIAGKGLEWAAPSSTSEE
jgi:hypothetical protein